MRPAIFSKKGGNRVAFGMGLEIDECDDHLFAGVIGGGGGEEESYYPIDGTFDGAVAELAAAMDTNADTGTDEPWHRACDPLNYCRRNCRQRAACEEAPK